MVESDSGLAGKNSPRLDSLLSKEKNVEFARPVYLDEQSRSEFTVTNSIIIKFSQARTAVEVEAWIQSRGLRRAGQLDDRTFALELVDESSNPLERCAIRPK